jgi:hypothetical protein
MSPTSASASPPPPSTSAPTAQPALPSAAVIPDAHAHSGSAPPFLCRPRELQPLLGKLEPRVFIKRADRLFCLFEAFLSQAEEPICISLAHYTRIMRERCAGSFSFEPDVELGTITRASWMSWRSMPSSSAVAVRVLLGNATSPRSWAASYSSARRRWAPEPRDCEHPNSNLRRRGPS